MPGYNNKPLTGYLETEYSSDWPGLVTNLPTSRIPPGACSACDAMVVRGRLTAQPAVYPVTGTGGLNVTLPTFAAGENVCSKANLPIPNAQQGFTVIITNIAVYSDYIGIGPVLPTKVFGKLYTFPTPYPRYARFGTKVIGNTLYFSSGSLLGVYALRPVYRVSSAIVTNPGGYFTGTPGVVFSDGGGTGASALATVSGGNLTAVTVGLSGFGYVSPPIINLTGGSATGPAPGQTTAAAVAVLESNPLNYVVEEVSALTGVAFVNTTAGSGYVNPTVAFTGGGGTGASATAILNGSGGIAAVVMVSPGNNYTTTPSVTIIDSNGSGAAAAAALFTGKPFIGGDFMTSIAQRLVLGNIIGGDGNNTVPLLDLKLTNSGAGYTNASTPPQVDIVGGGGFGAVGYATVAGGGFNDVNGVFLGQQAQFTGDTNSNTSITNISSSAGIQKGQTIIGADIPGSTTITGISGSTLTISNSALGSNPGESLASYGFVYPDAGNGYSSTPAVNITSDIGGGATAIAQLSNIPEANSSSTKYPYRVAWSAPNAFGFFDPNYSLAPGGFNDLAEAAGLVSSVNVVESVCFVGHNGGVTEMTPNTTSSQVPFSFYPIWGGDQGQLVRYGSMAQFGTTLAFLAQDTAYTLTPNGLQEIGGNIANLLQNVNLWNDGSYPLQGLYGSIVLIEGEKHYLIVVSSDTYNTNVPNTSRFTTVYDYNMNANNWHSWSWAGATMTDAIFQSFDITPSTPTTGNGLQMARDSWLLASWTVNTGGGPFGEQAAVYEIAPLTRSLQLLTLSVVPIRAEGFFYQFRTESPSIARMQTERRILIEYENLPSLVPLSVTPSLDLQYSGQEDPTTQTGTISQIQTQVNQSLNQLNTNVVNGQVLTSQVDFGSFTGVCTSLNLVATGSNVLFALVRITGIADLPKGIVP